MTKEPAVREIAMDVLIEVLEKKQYSHIILSQALLKYQYLDKQNRSFIKRVVDGTIEYLVQLDYIINSYSTTKVNKMKPVIRTILRMGVYQIYHMDRVPDSAACNEAVKLAERRGFRNLKGFVNGVLRNVSREKGTIELKEDYVRYAVPEWLFTRLAQQYGPEKTAIILDSFLKDRVLTVRCNTQKAPLADILESLNSQGVTAVSVASQGQVYALTGVDYLESLHAFTAGLIQVQDLSSSFAGDVAGIKQGDYVIDVCAAPGGKSLHAAELLQGSGMVEARDLSEQKVELIRQNIERAGCKNVKTMVMDACIYDEASEQKADVLLADLPCSGLGIIGRKPDIKHNASPERIEALSTLQREILSVVHHYVKPGGTLVYTTCTMDRRENEENMNWFLEQFPYKPVDIRGRLGQGIDDASMKDGYIQLLPGIHPCDGFFIAVMKRNEE